MLLSIPVSGCEPQCSLTDFKQKYESLRIIDWDEACANGHKSLNKGKHSKQLWDGQITADS